MFSIRPTTAVLLATLTAALPALSAPAAAQTADVTNNPPYSIQSGDPPGFYVEIVNEMAKLLKTKVTYDYMDWAAAMAKVRTGSDQLLFPFTRNPEREDQFGWLQKLFTNTVVFVSAPGSQPIDSIEQAKQLKAIGVLAGAPWGKELAARGITTAKAYPTSPAMIAAIVSGELPAAYGPEIELKYAWRTGGYQGTLVEGKQIQTSDQYLAMSKNSPSIKPDDWHEAFDALQQDGTFDRIFARYFGTR
ncbi:MAG TPA: transporter substrate-binding domain-containing protein [Acetobacteraceae bacterium]|nr:transporter substrate-binding domain-containing protein [Acetobacteraceae bacterium]